MLLDTFYIICLLILISDAEKKPISLYVPDDILVSSVY